MRKLALLLAALSLGASLAACNTVRGIGQDIERGGEIIQRTAK
ncbi:MAG: entericidin A/B family lipoprotein [Thauera sp.]|nr:entericidin A/B family lipoprotein [Thauera sp.]